jgi:hypothetical protein
LAGSNNCYEVNRNGSSGRRSRSWESSTFFCNTRNKEQPKPHKISATESEIKENVRQYIENFYLEKVRSTSEYDKDFREQFKNFIDFLDGSSQYWFSSKVPGGKIKNMLSYFSAPTITIKEYLEIKPSIELTKYVEGKMIFDHAKSEEELVEKMNIGFRIYDNEYSMDRILSQSKPATQPHKTIEQSHAYIITLVDPWKTYYITNTKGKMRFSDNKNSSKLYRTESLAKKALESIRSRATKQYTFEMVRIESTEGKTFAF